MTCDKICLICENPREIVWRGWVSHADINKNK